MVPRCSLRGYLLWFLSPSRLRYYWGSNWTNLHYKQPQYFPDKHYLIHLSVYHFSHHDHHTPLYNRSSNYSVPECRSTYNYHDISR